MAGPFRLPDALRRRLRLGIGGLMLAILIFALWLGDRVNRAREQRLAVEAIKASKGWVLYADEFTMGPVDVPPGNAVWKPSWGKLTKGKGPLAPAWLRRALGDEYVREVVHVSLFVDVQKGIAGAPTSDQRPVDEILREIQTQSSVMTLQMGGETVTDKGLESVARMTGLRELFVWWATEITDTGVAHLGKLPHLRFVDINLAQLTDESVQHLADLPELEELSLQGQKFTDQSLMFLSKATRLKSLSLRANTSEITDAGLEHLKGLKSLRRLDLEHSKIAMEGRQALQKAIPGLIIGP